MGRPRMRYEEHPDRCANCWSWSNFVDLSPRDYAEGREKIPQCPNCGYRPKVRWSEPYRGGVTVVKEE